MRRRGGGEEEEMRRRGDQPRRYSECMAVPLHCGASA